MGDDRVAQWYVVHTRTGYENKVATDLEKTVENRNMCELIQEIKVPTEEVIEIKDQKKKTITRKLFPCYILVKMIMTNETWYIVRNATGVTGFVGPGSEPVPLSDEEVTAMGVEQAVKLDFEIGESIKVSDDGMFDGFVGTVDAIDEEKQKVRVIVKMFSRDITVDLDFMQVKKM